MTEQETLILKALCCGENAQSLTTLAEKVALPFPEVIMMVDSLVAQSILTSDQNVIMSEIGIIVYSFAENKAAQEVYATLQKPCERISCPNLAEYLFFPEEKEIYHARFCQPCRKSVIKWFPKMRKEIYPHGSTSIS